MAGDSFDFNALASRDLPARRYDAGEKIFLEDDAGDCMYVVRSGCVEIITYGTILEVVKPNGVFGEMALIDGRSHDGSRSAAAIAREPTELAVIGKDAFLAFVREDPNFALMIMGLLAKRIRRMNSSL